MLPDDAMLDVLCPMHLRLDRSGHIVHAGPTLAKLAERDLVGRRFLEVFETRRPRNVATVHDLCAHAGSRMHLRMRDAHKTGLKGVLVCAPEKTGAIVNLSFGISIIDAVKRFRMNAADFAATDLAIELLYLVEAKSAAMEASRTLNQRLQGAMIAAEEQAFTDTLTGLKNRRALDHILARLVDFGGGFTLMHLDLDYFKAVNDTHGHAAGDTVLQQVARILVAETRDEDTVARVGGDEFVLVFNKPLPATRMIEISERLIARLEIPIPIGERTAQISGSIGLVSTPGGPQVDLPQLSEQADLALYASKHAGRGCFTIFHEGLSQTSPLKGLTAAQ